MHGSPSCTRLRSSLRWRVIRNRSVSSVSIANSEYRSPYSTVSQDSRRSFGAVPQTNSQSEVTVRACLQCLIYKKAGILELLCMAGFWLSYESPSIIPGKSHKENVAESRVWQPFDFDLPGRPFDLRQILLPKAVANLQGFFQRPVMTSPPFREK